MLHYESAYSAEELVERVNAHKGTITIHSIQNITVIGGTGLPLTAFIAFFTVSNPAPTAEGNNKVPVEQRKFIGQTPKHTV